MCTTLTRSLPDLTAEVAARRERIRAAARGHGFVEREAALAVFLAGSVPTTQAERYLAAFEAVLAAASTPIATEDRLLGRMVEGPLHWPMEGIPGGGQSHAGNPFTVRDRMCGHMTIDYAALVGRGLTTIADDAAAAARTPAEQGFARCTRRAVAAIVTFARRYAVAARGAAADASAPQRGHLLRAAAALDIVPGRPARNFFAALQSVWFMHLLLSCVTGGRDFAFGRLDQYLWPLYRDGLERGSFTRDDARTWLAQLFLSCNEIAGVGAVLGTPKPVPCGASKQYLVVGGRTSGGGSGWNDLSLLLLETAMLVRLPEPVLTVRLDAATPTDCRSAAARAACQLGGQLHFYNDEVVIPALVATGIPVEEAVDYTMSGCCRPDFPGHQTAEVYHNAVAWLLEALTDPADPAGSRIASMDDLVQRLRTVARRELARGARAPRSRSDDGEPVFHLESLLLRDCARRSRDLEEGGLRREVCCHYFAGIATVADSLAAIEHIVWRERRMELPAFLAVAARDFVGAEELLHYIRHHIPCFGNDRDEGDRIACRVGEEFLDALTAVNDGRVHVGGFYSLFNHHEFGRSLPATPDGRRRGQPISENMSPTYGRDWAGVTALLKSVAKLPLRRAPAGGLNVLIASRVPVETCAAMVSTFFSLGGLHLGITAVDRETLINARIAPDQYRSLCVRVTGFSEHFVELPAHLQAEVISRTEHGA